MKNLLLLVLSLAFSMPVFGQKPGGLSRKQVAELDKIFEPAQKSVRDALKKRDLKKFDAWQADLLAAAKITDYDERQKTGEEIQAKYATFFKAGYAAAKIDEKEYQQAIIAYFKKFGWKPVFGQYLTFVIRIEYPLPTTGTGSDCQFLKCPFSVVDIESTSQSWGAGYGDEAGDDGECGITSRSTVMVNGGFQQKTGIGEYVEVKPNISKVEVSAKLSKYSFSGDAKTGFGSGYSYIACGIAVSGEGLEQDFVLDEVVAYSPFGTEDQWYLFEKTNQIVKMAFTPNINGGTYKIQLFAKTSVSSSGWGTARSECVVSRPTDFKICQKPK